MMIGFVHVMMVSRDSGIEVIVSLRALKGKIIHNSRVQWLFSTEGKQLLKWEG
jgi:hypothetical protein